MRYKMNITVIAIGKLKEKYWQDAISEYSKRMKSYCNLQIIELKESPLRANPSAADEQAVKDAEGADILSKIKPSDYVITLEIKGKGLSSEQLAKKIDTLGIDGKSSIVFVIGGSLGLSESVSKRSDFKLSFSAMTFPHQMMRVILLEQVYRSFKINRNEAYHK
jgi:23S rRNA (pseudouridine1915-N3)-methyltransferase